MALHIALIGMPAIGKTTIGRKLARHYGRPFVDLDHVIEQHIGCRIAEYFERMGEAAFRDVESRVLAEQLQGSEPLVISTGGGIVLRPENRAALRQHSHAIYLSAPPEMLLQRVRQDRTRPLLQVADPLQRLRELHAQRQQLYQDTADCTVHVEGLGMRGTLQAIERHLRPLGICPQPASHAPGGGPG